MFRALGNIAIILLICFAATGISINSCPVLDTSSSALNDEITDILLVTNDQVEQLYNPNNITVKYKANKDVVLDFSEDYLLKATIYRDDEIYKTHYMHKIDSNKPLAIEITEDTPYSVSVDISQNKLKLPNGSYSFSIVPNISDSEYSVAPLMLNISYESNARYIPATNNVPENKMPLTLYFSDTENSIEQLIGVTRYVDYNKKPLTTLIEELRKGPSLQLGLSLNPPIGVYNYISIKGSTAYVDLPSKEKIYTQDPVKSEIAMNSFIKSITSFENIDKIRFLVDYNKADIFFNGNTITKAIEEDNSNKAYLAYNTTSRYFLVDCSVKEITEESTVQKKAHAIFKTLKEDKYYGLSNTIPDNVELIDYKINDNTIALNFNSEFVNAYEKNENLQRLMLDSIIYSFTSIDDIDDVLMSVDNKPIYTFSGVDLSSPLGRPLYINPETESE